jgi:tetratricopeptide (TPR) repeat protein
MAAAAMAGQAAAADLPRYGPPATWVEPLPIPKVAPAKDGPPIQILLQDTQSRFGQDADEFYAELAIRIQTTQGLEAMANVARSWNPETETLVFHRFNIIRDGRVIDLLQGGKKVTVLRRETNLELAMLDGALTATIQPEGLQIGDTVDLAITLERRDPVFHGYSEAIGSVAHAGSAGRLHIRATWPDAKPMRWRATAGLPDPKLRREEGRSELVVDQTDGLAPIPPRDAPIRYADVGQLEVSQFQTWSEASSLMAPLYAKAAVLSDNSPLRVEVEKIKAQTSDPKKRAEAALRLVQDQVHYVFLGMNSGGYVPADADVTWSRRFGDCKGKTALLLALLRGLGVEAQPALVSTVLGDGLDQRLPQLRLFDHVFVRAVIGGKVYWLDGTRVFDRSLDDIPRPNFHWVLPLQDSDARLENVQPAPFDAPAYESVERLDASGGFEVPAPAHVEHIFRGDAAIAWQLSLHNAGRTEAERSLREYWRRTIPWIEPNSVDFTYDDARHVMSLSTDGAAKMDWTKVAGDWDFDIGDSNLGFKTSFRREPGPHADAPYAVDFPTYEKWTVVIKLPNGGQGFHLVGADDVNSTIAGHRYQRQTQLNDGVVTMVAEDRTIASEFPAAEADAASAQLRALADFDVSVRGPSKSSASLSMLAEPPPSTAAAFNTRGVERLARREYDLAIADFTQAVRLDGATGKYFYHRGAAYYEKRQDDLALQDFAKAIALNPSDTLAYLARAELLLIKGNEPLARKDFDEAQRLAPNDLSVLTRRVFAYERAGLFEDAVHGYDALLAKTSDQARRATLLNDRCWARASWGRELDQALADCDAALVIAPNTAKYLDSRGFVRFRLGQFDAAITDYDAALSQTPNLPASLFGRGLARWARGQKAEAAVDINAARRASPAVDRGFARFGVTAPAEVQPKDGR